MLSAEEKMAERDTGKILYVEGFSSVRVRFLRPNIRGLINTHTDEYRHLLYILTMFKRAPAISGRRDLQIFEFIAMLRDESFKVRRHL